MTSLGKRIQYIRKNIKYFTQQQLIDAVNNKYNLNISRCMLSNWERDMQIPHIATLRCIAQTLGVSLDYLTNCEIKYNMAGKTTVVPQIGSKGGDVYAVVDMHNENYADFCIRIFDDNMKEENISEGDIVFVHKQECVKNGELAVIKLDNKIFIKRYYEVENKTVLVSGNRKCAPQVFLHSEKNRINIMGKVVLVQRKII